MGNKQDMQLENHEMIEITKWKDNKFGRPQRSCEAKAPNVASHSLV
jgi:hypothetical protein